MIKERKLEKWDFISQLVFEETKYYRKKGKSKEYQQRNFTINWVINGEEIVDTRIYSKFKEILETYRSVVERNLLFDMCTEIIQELAVTKDYIIFKEKIKEGKDKGKYKDDISYIITTLQQRIIDKVNGYTGSHRDRSKGKDTFVNVKNWSLDYRYKDEEGNTYTLGDITEEEKNIFHNYEVSKSDADVEKALREIFVKAKLTNKEIEVLRALEHTRDNIIQNKFYNKAEASRILGCSRENVSQIFTNIKRKVSKVYKIDYTRQDRIDTLFGLLDIIDTALEVINYINDNLDGDLDVESIFYSVDSELIQYFINNRYDDRKYKSDTMRKFATYYIKEIYNYIELLEENKQLEQEQKENVSIA